MGIDNIKPPAGPGPSADPSAETSSLPAGKGGFADATGKLQTSGSAPPETSGMGVVSQFSRAAFEDPDKRQAMVRACVSELIDSGRSLTGQLSGAQKETLLNFLSQDPLVRTQIETYLQKVLV